MEHEGGCCGGDIFAALEPSAQAEYLTLLAQEARLLEFALEAADAESLRIGAALQRTLERAIDADAPDEKADARRELESVLTGARDAGLRVSAQVGEVDVDGVAGTMRMRVLSTVLARPAQAVPA